MRKVKPMATGVRYHGEMLSESVADHSRQSGRGHAFWWRLTDNLFRRLGWFILPVVAMTMLGFLQASKTVEVFQSTGTLNAASTFPNTGTPCPCASTAHEAVGPSWLERRIALMLSWGRADKPGERPGELALESDPAARPRSIVSAVAALRLPPLIGCSARWLSLYRSCERRAHEHEPGRRRIGAGLGRRAQLR